MRMRKVDNNLPFCGILLKKQLKLSTYYISLCKEDGFTSRHDNTRNDFCLRKLSDTLNYYVILSKEDRWADLKMAASLTRYMIDHLNRII